MEKYQERITFRAPYVVAVSLLGGWLRLRHLGLPSFWLDEVLGYDLTTAAAKQPLWRWLTIFDLEHGPLYYAGELAGRFLRQPELSARLVPALLGTATIVVGWFAARAIRSHPATPFIFTLLLAVSPLHVYYSREARPYALVALVATALLAIFLREPRLRSTIAILAIAIYSSATAVSVIVAAAFAAAARRWWRVAALCALSVLPIAFCYHPARHTVAETVDWSLLGGLIESFSVVALDTSRLHFAAWVFATLAIAGAAALARRDRGQAIVAMAFAVIPVAFVVIAAIATHHFVAVRYAIGALPAYLLLVSVGVVAIARRFAIPAAMLLALAGWHAAVSEPFRKLDWRGIAAAIEAHAHENDPVIAANDSTSIALGFYLRGKTPRVRTFNAQGSGVFGEIFHFQGTSSWIVVAGYDEDFNKWSARFPVLLSSPLENFSLRYSPSAYYYLTDRATPAEVRALLGTFGGRVGVRFGPGDHDLLGDGWSRSERGLVTQKRALLALPVPQVADHALYIQIEPAQPQQLVMISINGKDVQNLALRDGRHTYIVIVPRDRWRNGINTVGFDFSSARLPSARVYAVGIDGLDFTDRSHPLQFSRLR